jgi:hypothetical protein
MALQTQIQNRVEATGRSSSVDTVLGLAVIGCIIAGAVGIAKALSMDSGFGVLLCLVGSVVSFGAVFYIYLGKH